MPIFSQVRCLKICYLDEILYTLHQLYPLSCKIKMLIKIPDVTEHNVQVLAQRVGDLCESLNAKLTLPAIEDLEGASPKYTLFMEEFRKLQIEDKPISSLIPPQHTTLIGYRAMVLELERLRKHKFNTPERVEEFCKVNLEASGLWNQNTLTRIKNANLASICQNIHLVPGDSVKPSVTIHLHKENCDGNLCKRNEALGVKSDAVTVCGSYQEFYFMKLCDSKPCFRLCIKKGDQELEDTAGIALQLEEKELPVPIVELDDKGSEERISPEEAFKLWKLRFVALFMSPAVLHFFRLDLNF